jgi:hypothetical protein
LLLSSARAGASPATDTATDIADIKERKVFKFIWTPHLHCAVCACVVEKEGSIIERR